MTEKKDAPPVDRVLLFDLLDDVMEEERTIRGGGPVHGIGGIGAGQNDLLDLRFVLPLRDERLTAAPGAMESEDERKLLLRRHVFRDAQKIDPLLSFRGDLFFGNLARLGRAAG